jgi:nitrite reductase (NADH) small subunit
VGTAALGCPAEQSSASRQEHEPMPSFTKLTTQSELPATDEVKEFLCGAKMICVANVNSEYSAMDNVCLHRGGPLGEGEVEKGKVVCPWHGWAWDPKTGEAVQDPKSKLAVYALKIENGEVLIEI